MVIGDRTLFVQISQCHAWLVMKILDCTNMMNTLQSVVH